MKLIAWNCNMAFRKKASLVLAYKPDIVVVPECESIERLKFAAETIRPKDALWFGENMNKGLGIFSYSKYRFQVLKEHDDKFKMVVPILVSGNKKEFLLFAVWANNPRDPDGVYVEQVWKAINHYDKLLTNKQIILAGDFNSNTIWDRPRRTGNHSTVVKKLSEKGIHSTYHHHFKQVQGKEEHPTQYMYRHKDKPYHLDYCFASEDWIRKLRTVEIGEHEYWCKYSDHVPVIVEFR